MSNPYRLTHKLMMNQPLEEMQQLFPHIQKDSAHQSINRWSEFQYEQKSGFALHDVELIQALFDEHQVNSDPWGDPLNLGERRLSFLHHTHRARARTFALDASEQHHPKIFYSKWLPWIELAFKEAYLEAKESAKTEELEYPHQLYQTLRSVSLRVVAHTICVAFKGNYLQQLTTELEGLDTVYARICLGGKRTRFGIFTSNDIKIALQHAKALDALIRPMIRERIGGTSQGDDLLGLWVNTRGQDGRSLKEDQIIDQVTSFLIMAYTSLPKLIYGAAFSLAHPDQKNFLDELQRELNHTLKVITNPPILEEGTPPPITPENESGEKSLPLHHAVILESLRLYSPHWLSQFTIKNGEFSLGIMSKGEEEVKVDSTQQLWISALALHHHPERFKNPNRFWPQRWSGSLDSSLPRHGFAPFGFIGKPALSELYCKELATRILMIWLARYTVVQPPTDLEWELGLCLRPTTDLSWVQRRDLEQKV